MAEVGLLEGYSENEPANAEVVHWVDNRAGDLLRRIQTSLGRDGPQGPSYYNRTAGQGVHPLNLSI